MAHYILCQFENCAIISLEHFPIMHDYDYDGVWEFEASCHDYLDEESGWTASYLDDEMDYERSDSTDYQQLAYIHFA